MSFDGIFVKHLLEEMLHTLQNNRINKIINVSDTEIVFLMQSKAKVLFSLNPQNPHFRLTNVDFLNSNTLLSNFLKKKIEGSRITKAYQVSVDRVIVLEVENYDDLGYKKNYNLVFEFIGKNANLIITDQDFIIQEAIKKSYLTDDRIVQPKVKFEFLKQEKTNPFTYDLEYIDENIFIGIGPLLYKEIMFSNSLKNTINQVTKPTIFLNDKRPLFYCFDLMHITADKMYFNTLSDMLEYYYLNLKNEEVLNLDQKKLSNFINKELTKLRNKLEKQNEELIQANKNLEYENLANILTSNIHLVRKHQEEIKVFNYYNNTEVILKLNPKIKPTENINQYFNKFKKAKRTIEHLSNTINETKQEISYYETLISQSTNISLSDLKEIITEVGLSKDKSKPQKPNILKYQDSLNNIYLVGKNNKQNEYITFSLANKNDYFFHVHNYPGSHVILKGELSSESIYNAAILAAYYSKSNSNVSVNYTLVKWVKKIKGMKGSFVSYSNELSINVPSSLDEINKNLSIVK